MGLKPRLENLVPGKLGFPGNEEVEGEGSQVCLQRKALPDCSRGPGEGRLECWEELATKEPRAELLYWDGRVGGAGPETGNQQVTDLGGVRGPLHSFILTTLICPLFKIP